MKETCDRVLVDPNVRNDRKDYALQCLDLNGFQHTLLKLGGETFKQLRFSKLWPISFQIAWGALQNLKTKNRA